MGSIRSFALALVTLASAGSLACEPALQEAAPRPPPDPGRLELRGGIASFPGGTSTLLVEIEAADALERTAAPDVRATGTLVPMSGPRVALTGSYDPVTGALELTSELETFTAVRSTVGFDGSYTGSLGDGAFGIQGEAEELQVFCGSALSHSGNPGTVVLVVGGEGVVGGAIAAGIGFTGPVTGSLVGSRLLFGFVSAGSAEGTVTEDGALNGTWTARAAEGTFSASVDRCPLP